MSATIRYFPQTEADIAEMLAAVGADSIDSLFDSIPPDCRMDAAAGFAEPMSEWQVTKRLENMAALAGGDWQVFVNAGSQQHYIPAIVPYLAGRSEFLTAYTPYQPEASQGTLQAIFEFQTLISRLTGLAVANASMYDGSTAMAESALMAQRVTKRRTLLVSELVHPHWLQVLRTYFAPADGVEIVILPANPDGTTDCTACAGAGDPAALIIQSPNFLGVVEDISAASACIHSAGGLLAVGFSEPFAYGVFASPGTLGADIAFGEGQSFGLAQSFGGPGLGLMAAKAEYMRQMPGRLVGQTIDSRGQRGFVLTLSTREQHIRRGKAVSNICSNAGHAALTTAIYMASVGGTGFRALAKANRDVAEYLKSGLMDRGFAPVSTAPTFNEFAMIAPPWWAKTHARLQQRKILAGIPLAEMGMDRWTTGDAAAWLFGVTETKDKGELDALLEEVKP